MGVLLARGCRSPCTPSPPGGLRRLAAAAAPVRIPIGTRGAGGLPPGLAGDQGCPRGAGAEPGCQGSDGTGARRGGEPGRLPGGGSLRRFGASGAAGEKRFESGLGRDNKCQGKPVTQHHSIHRDGSPAGRETPFPALCTDYQILQRGVRSTEYYSDLIDKAPTAREVSYSPEASC